MVTAEDIEYLRRAQMLPTEDHVVARAPGGELVPEPEEGEYVVFAVHFSRGFGLPVSQFFRLFMDTFDLQPHHLGPNSIIQLSSFVTLCEGYLGLLPTVDLWGKMFFLKQQGATASAMSDCGAAVVTGRPNGPFPKLPLEDLAKKW